MLNWASLNRATLADRHYTMKGTAPNYFFNLRPRVLGEYACKPGGNFCLIIIGDEAIEDDFYVIPFDAVNSLFTEDKLAKGEKTPRWLCNIFHDRLHVYPGGQRNAGLEADIGKYRGNRSCLG
jgi:hypothetical protein